MERNKIYNIDCQEGLKTIPDGSVDLIVTDPPFDVDLIETNLGRQKQVKRDKCYVEWNCDYGEMSKEFYRVLKENTHCYIWCGDKQIPKWIVSMEKVGFGFRQILVWTKNMTILTPSARNLYMRKTENCLYFVKGNRELNPPYNRNNVFTNRITKKKLHPTTKPLGIWQRLIGASSNEGDLVLDPFMGAGGVASACKSIHRDYIGFEISPVFVEKANQQLRQRCLW